MNLISRRRSAIAIAVALIAFAAIGAIFLEWQLAQKVRLTIDQGGIEVASFVYRRDSDDLDRCRADLRHFIESLKGGDFTFDVDMAMSGDIVMLTLASTYRVQYMSGTLVLQKLHMDGEVSEFFSSIVRDEAKLHTTLIDRITELFTEFRESARVQLQQAEAAY